MRSASSSHLPSRAVTPQITTNPAPNSNHTVKSHSTTNLPTLAGQTAATASQPHDRSRSDNLDFNTISRTPTPLSNGSRTPPSVTPHHPELNDEVANLSTKLINSINHQTALDDSLQSTRGELDGANTEIERLRQQVEEERQQRIGAERQKRKLEGEVESLTSSLFEEANGMVAQARREHEQAEQRADQLKAQLRDAETLLTSHQDQLRELKRVLSSVQSEEGSGDASAQLSAPSTPTVGMAGKRSAEFLGGNRPPIQPMNPDHPLSFAQVITPVMRSDLQSFDDFVSMLKAGQNVAPSSRTNSGNFAGLNVMGIGSLSNFNQSYVSKSPQLASTTNSSLASSSPQPHNMPGAFNQNDMGSSPTIASSLKDQRFYKRALQEDIEPTLRLDSAPGLSWLARRNVVSSMVSGNLIVEPFPPSNRYWSSAYMCALCGESRDDEPYIRRHRFYKGDQEDSQRYMICDYCLARLRATGDFINFLRMVRSGYWRGESIEDSKVAWDQCTKLRERMFWARLGGGVVPLVAGALENVPSPKTSREVSAEDRLAEQASVAETGAEVSKEKSTGSPGRVSASGSPERRPNLTSETSTASTGSSRFLAARSRFESTSSESLKNSRPNTPAEAGASEQKRRQSSASPSKSPSKKPPTSEEK